MSGPVAAPPAVAEPGASTLAVTASVPALSAPEEALLAVSPDEDVPDGAAPVDAISPDLVLKGTYNGDLYDKINGTQVHERISFMITYAGSALGGTADIRSEEGLLTFALSGTARIYPKSDVLRLILTKPDGCTAYGPARRVGNLLVGTLSGRACGGSGAGTAKFTAKRR